MVNEAKLSIGRVLALSGSVFAARWLAFCGLILIAVVLAIAAVAMLFFGCTMIIEAMPGGGGGLEFNDAQSAVMTATLCIQVVVGFSILQIGAAAVAFGTVQYFRSVTAPFGRCLGHGFAVMLPVVGAASVAALIVSLPIVGAVLLGGYVSEAFFLAGPIIAFLLAVPFAVAVPAAALERASVRSALARSLSLVRNNYFRTLGLLLLLGAISFGAGVLLGLASDILGDLILLVSIAVMLAIGVFAAVVMAVTYVELRHVNEGFGAEELANLFD